MKLVAETGESLERIMGQVAEINGVVGEIAAGAEEQAHGLEEVNSAINQMDKVTRQNAAMVEETTAASHSLSQETEKLSQLIGQFQIGEGVDDALRGELRRAAPHAFAKPKPAEARRPEMREARVTRGPRAVGANHSG